MAGFGQNRTDEVVLKKTKYISSFKICFSCQESIIHFIALIFAHPTLGSFLHLWSVKCIISANLDFSKSMLIRSKSCISILQWFIGFFMHTRLKTFIAWFWTLAKDSNMMIWQKIMTLSSWNWAVPWYLIKTFNLPVCRHLRIILV